MCHYFPEIVDVGGKTGLRVWALIAALERSVVFAWGNPIVIVQKPSAASNSLDADLVVESAIRFFTRRWKQGLRG